MPDRSKPHFAYLAQSRRLCETRVDVLVEAIKLLLKKEPLGISAIVAFTQQQVAEVDESAGVAFDWLASSLGFGFGQGASVVCCRNALPHDDPSYSGEAFVSLVLHTGPGPYAFSIHSRRGREKRSDPKSSRWSGARRFLVRGDILVMDPTDLHAASPVHPSESSVLVLLQGFYPLNNRQAHKSLLRAFPRHSFDRNETDEADLVLHNLPMP